MDVKPNPPNTVISKLSLRLSQPPVSVSLPNSQDIKAKSLLLFIFYISRAATLDSEDRRVTNVPWLHQPVKVCSMWGNYSRNKLWRNSPVKFEKYSPDDPFFVEQSAAGAHGKSGATPYWFDPRLQSQQLVRSIHLTAPFRMDWSYTEYRYFPGCCSRANKTSLGWESAEDPLFSWIPLPASQVR